MRIVLIGQAAFGESLLKLLLEKGKEVVGVYTLPDVSGKANPIKEIAIKANIPVFQPKRMRDPEVYSEYVKLEPELNVMAFVTDILPLNILSYPRSGSIQYHPSLLPKHRGGSAINWAIINGDTRTGISIFWPDEGIDTGPILMQKEAEISPDDTVGSIYFNKLFNLGVAAMEESIELVESGSAPRIPQDESQATHEGLCTENDALVDWSQPAPQVYNLIRGTNPQPGATTRFGGKRVKIFDSAFITMPVDRPCGEILQINEEGLLVAAGGGAILVKRVQSEGSTKVPAWDYAQSLGLKVGDGFSQIT